MSVNRTAEYVVLWKSHKRAEWAAVGLDSQAEALRQRLGRSPGRKAANIRRYGTPAASTRDGKPADAGAVRAVETAAAGAQRAAINPATDAPAAGVVAPGVAAEVVAEIAIADQLESLETESCRTWQLYAEIGSELAQVAALLTVAQRKSAEKVLKQWEESGAGA